MATTKQPVPAIRATASAGLVHFGLSEYEWVQPEQIPLGLTATPARARAIAARLDEVADEAERIADAFPELAPVDPDAAITATATVGAPGNESVRADELRDDDEPDHGEIN